MYDVGSYSSEVQNGDRNSKKRDRTLEAGMVLTVEPGLYIVRMQMYRNNIKGLAFALKTIF